MRKRSPLVLQGSLVLSKSCCSKSCPLHSFRAIPNALLSPQIQLWDLDGKEHSPHSSPWKSSVNVQGYNILCQGCFMFVRGILRGMLQGQCQDMSVSFWMTAFLQVQDSFRSAHKLAELIFCNDAQHYKSIPRLSSFNRKLKNMPHSKHQCPPVLKP